MASFYDWMKSKMKWWLASGVIMAAVTVAAYFWTKRTSTPATHHSNTTVTALNSDQTTISNRFARAPFFRINNEIVPNPYVDALPAGPQTAEFIAALGASTVKAGSFGPVALQKLKELGIRAVTG